MKTKEEAVAAASESLINTPTLTHNSLLHKPFEQKNYNCVESTARGSSTRAAYLTYTDKSPSTPEEIDSFCTANSLKLYNQIIYLFNNDKKEFRYLYTHHSFKIKYVNHDNVILYSPPNHGGNSSCGYSMAIENSNKKNASISSRNNARDKALANVDIWAYFCTFTLDGKKQSRHDFTLAHHRITHFLQSRHIKYFLVPERHKDGAWHFHALVSKEIEPFLADFEGKACQNPYIKARLAKGETVKNFVDYARTYGYNIVEPCKNKEACVLYLIKYVLKTFDDPNFERVSRRRYFCSTGLRSAFVLHPRQALQLDLNEFQTITFSHLISKVVLKRYKPEEEIERQHRLNSQFSPPSV